MDRPSHKTRILLRPQDLRQPLRAVEPRDLVLAFSQFGSASSGREDDGGLGVTRGNGARLAFSPYGADSLHLLGNPGLRCAKPGLRWLLQSPGAPDGTRGNDARLAFSADGAATSTTSKASAASARRGRSSLRAQDDANWRRVRSSQASSARSGKPRHSVLRRGLTMGIITEFVPEAEPPSNMRPVRPGLYRFKCGCCPYVHEGSDRNAPLRRKLSACKGLTMAWASPARLLVHGDVRSRAVVVACRSWSARA